MYQQQHHYSQNPTPTPDGLRLVPTGQSSYVGDKVSVLEDVHVAMTRVIMTTIENTLSVVDHSFRTGRGVPTVNEVYGELKIMPLVSKTYARHDDTASAFGNGQQSSAPAKKTSKKGKASCTPEKYNAYVNMLRPDFNDLWRETGCQNYQQCNGNPENMFKFKCGKSASASGGVCEGCKDKKSGKEIAVRLRNERAIDIRNKAKEERLAYARKKLEEADYNVDQIIAQFGSSSSPAPPMPSNQQGSMGSFSNGSDQLNTSPTPLETPSSSEGTKGRPYARKPGAVVITSGTCFGMVLLNGKLIGVTTSPDDEMLEPSSRDISLFEKFGPRTEKKEEPETPQQFTPTSPPPDDFLFGQNGNNYEPPAPPKNDVN